MNTLKISEKQLRKATCIIVALWLVAQIVAIIYRWGAPFYSDAANYLAFASEAAAENSWYPTASQMSSNAWIANTGYINFLVANLYLFGNITFVAIEQLLLNCLLLFSLWKLATRFGGPSIGYLTAILFCILPSNILCVTPLMSDLMCISLFLFSTLLVRKNWLWLIAAGTIAALANWVRPVGMLYWPSVLIISFIVSHKQMRVLSFLKYTLIYVAGVLATDGLIMTLTHHTSGVALSGSTTKGTNMIIGCNDQADGGYSQIAFEKGNTGYVEPGILNAVERDKELTRRSIEWIMAHPGQFIALVPAKIFRLWCADYYNDKVYSATNEKDSMSKLAFFSATYYLVLLLALTGIWVRRRDLWGISGAILLPVLLGTGMHLLMYGGMRYHYPMMPPLIYFAAIGAAAILRKKASTTSPLRDSIP